MSPDFFLVVAYIVSHDHNKLRMSSALISSPLHVSFLKSADRQLHFPVVYTVRYLGVLHLYLVMIL